MSSSSYRPASSNSSRGSSSASRGGTRSGVGSRGTSARSSSGLRGKSVAKEAPVVRRSVRRVVGLFIDGPALDRASRRLHRRVDFSALIRGVCPGTAPLVARYYTVIPYEDDSRHRSFLDAIRGAGFDVIVKRLPPKGINRQVSVDPDMAADMLAFAFGHNTFAHSPDLHDISLRGGAEDGEARPEGEAEDTREVRRCITVVCPSRELAYPLWLSKQVGVDTTTADFSKFASGDFMRTATKWMDLTDSQTIFVSSEPPPVRMGS